MNVSLNFKTTHLLKELLDLNDIDSRSVEKHIIDEGYHSFLDNLEKLDLSVELLVKLQIFRELTYLDKIN